ncbi:phage holin, lambda family [Salmonella enterica]|nr:phage holin, lambda family [Salmonella enterica]
MNDKDPGLWADIVSGIKNVWPQLSGAILAVLIRYGMLIYYGSEKKSERVECLICGLLTLSFTSVLGVIGLPDSVAPALGGAIGLFGVRRLEKIALKVLSKRVGGNDETN